MRVGMVDHVSGLTWPTSASVSAMAFFTFRKARSSFEPDLRRGMEIANSRRPSRMHRILGRDVHGARFSPASTSECGELMNKSDSASLTHRVSLIVSHADGCIQTKSFGHCEVMSPR